jgi:hypothetical protein
MVPCPQFAPEKPRRFEFPRSSTRLQIPNVYIKVVGRILPEPFGCAMFEPHDRRLHRPGAVVDLDALPRPCVVIECTGPVGAWQRGKKRDRAYILWRLDFSRYEWVEICRAQSLDASWSAVFREPAMRALYPRPELVDVIGRSLELADDLLAVIDEKLMPERTDIRRTVLDTLYERVAGRIVDCA